MPSNAPCTMRTREAKFYEQQNPETGVEQIDSVQERAAFTTWIYAIRFAFLFYTGCLRKELDLRAYNEIKALASKHAVEHHKLQTEKHVARAALKTEFQERKIRPTQEVAEKAETFLRKYPYFRLQVFAAELSAGANPDN